MDKKSTYNFIRDIREDALWNLYTQMRASGQFTSLFAISSEIERMPMPLHFISYRMARALYNRYYDRGIHQTRQAGRRKQLYDSFIRHCDRIRADSRSQHMDSRDIIKSALLSPAPCIGISESMIRRILVSRGAH